MKTPQWTSGPWYVADENRDDIQHCARFGSIVVYAQNDCDIHPVADCSCNHTCRETEEQVANARLIAAAPELYAALKAILAADERGQGVNYAEAMELGRIALLKARGEQ